MIEISEFEVFQLEDEVLYKVLDNDDNIGVHIVTSVS